MKKCPNCGTILDDSKKKCYMCGTDLNPSLVDAFNKGFNNDVATNVFSSSDNVFNNGNDIQVNPEEVLDENNEAFFSYSSQAKDFYSSEINKLNSMEYEGRSDFKKNIDSFFKGDKAFKSKDELNKERLKESKKEEKKKEKKAQVKEETPVANVFVQNNSVNKNELTNVKIDSLSDNISFNHSNNDNNVFVNNNILENDKIVKNKEKEKKTKKVKEKTVKEIKTTKVEEKGLKKGSVKPVINKENIAGLKNIIFNSISIIVFLGLLIFCYFRFIRTDYKEVSLGRLNYRISRNMNLKSDDKLSRVYNYGETCSMKLEYDLSAVNSDHLTKKTEEITERFKDKQDYTIRKEIVKINSNSWNMISVIQVIEDPTATSGVSSLTKYKYVFVIYDTNMYSITYMNENNDNQCSIMFDDLLKSLYLN